MIAGIFNSQSWQTDYSHGFVVGLTVAAGIVILLFAIWLILHLTVWSRRCSAVTVAHPEGDIVVSLAAIAEALEGELEAFPELRLTRVRLLKYESNYKLTLNCELKGSAGVVELADRVRPKLKEALHRTFGVENLTAVSIVIERYTASPGGKAAPAAPRE